MGRFEDRGYGKGPARLTLVKLILVPDWSNSALLSPILRVVVVRFQVCVSDWLLFFYTWFFITKERSLFLDSHVRELVVTKVEGVRRMGGVMLNNHLLRVLEQGHTEVEISKSLILFIKLSHVAWEVLVRFIEVMIKSMAEIDVLSSENSGCY